MVFLYPKISKYIKYPKKTMLGGGGWICFSPKMTKPLPSWDWDVKGTAEGMCV